jgi:hypothetical protein
MLSPVAAARFMPLARCFPARQASEGQNRPEMLTFAHPPARAGLEKLSKSAISGRALATVAETVANG